ncbi:E3 ubiquitin-protein ligase, partial [Globisporangium splendens]
MWPTLPQASSSYPTLWVSVSSSLIHCFLPPKNNHNLQTAGRQMAAIPTQDVREFLRFLRAQPLASLHEKPPRSPFSHQIASQQQLLPVLLQQVVRRAIEPEYVPAFLDAILLGHFTDEIESDAMHSVSASGGDMTPDQSYLTPQSPSPYPSPSLSPASPLLDPHQLHAHNQPAKVVDRFKTAVPRDAFFQQFTPKSSSHGLCGYIFQRNDIAFNCKTCQLDETCVLCLNCYRNGNHEGHDIFFHRTFPGGCCDCGDSEAWDPDGFCIYHGDRTDQDGGGTSGEISDEPVGLPEELVRVADVLFEEIVLFFVEMAKKSMDVFDSEKVDVMGRQLQNEYRLHMQQDAHSELYGGSAIDPPVFHVRICNDDVHSDEDLITSLTKKNIPDPRELVRSIDSNGYEIVAANVSLRDALTLMQELKSEGWHVCVVEDQHIHDENVFLHMVRWVKQIGSLSKLLLNMFYAKLFDSSNPISAPKEPIQVMFLSDPYFRKESVLELYQLYLKLQGDKDPKLQFAVVFAKVYNRMMTRYFCGIGTRDESLFQYGVQIFTTPSIVSHLAEQGVLEMLLDTMNVALDLAKSTKLSAVVTSSNARSLPPAISNMSRTLDCDHALLKFRRFTFATDNIGYVFNIPTVASEMLLRKHLLCKWFDALRQIQGLDPQVRIQDGHAHVTYETQLWFTAFSFHSTITKLQTLLVKGLRNDEGTGDEGKLQMIHNFLDCFWEQLDSSGITDTVLQLYTPPFGYLMGARQEKIVKFDVGSQPVSFHYPLHSLLASFLLESMYYGPGSMSTSSCWITDWKAFIEDSIHRFYNVDASVDQEDANSTFQHKKSMLIYGMMEYPLRTLVLCAQIHSGLWIRNGQSMHRQMVNYMSPPWCSELRDLDLFALQISASIVGFPKFFTIYFDRFGLSEWLLSLKNSRNSISRDFPSDGDDDKLVNVLEAALLQLIWIITELPPPLDAIQEHDFVLRREIVHRLTQHPCRLSELLDQTSFMVSTAFGGVASRHEKQHLARLERILHEVADVQVKRSSLMSPFLPGGDDASGGGVMEPNKYVLKKEYFKEYDPGFYHLSRSSHEKAQFARQEALFKTWKVEDTPIPMVEQLPPSHGSLSPIRFMVLEKGFIGILRLLLEDATIENLSLPKQTNMTVVLRVIHLVNIMVLVLKNSGHQTRARQTDAILSEGKKRQALALLRSGPDTFEEDDDWRGKKRVRRQANQESDVDVQMSSDDQGESNNSEVQEMSIVSLLVTFAKDQVKNDFETSKSTISAIYWILKELSALDPIVYSFVEHIFYSGTKKQDDNASESSLSKAELKKLHQQRAIEAMMARQKAFAQSSFFTEMEDDEDEEDDKSTNGTDHDGDSAGGLHDSTAGSAIVYRPPPVPDCIICSQKKKDDPIMYIGHSQMSQVTAHALRGNHSYEDHTEAPLKSFPPQLYLSLCGHAVHLHCWKKYFESVKAQSRYNLEQSQSNVAFDAHFGEFLCPLCQSLSSMVVPYVPLSKALTLDDRQKDREALERVFQSKQDTSSILSWISAELPARLAAIEMEDDGEFSEDDECTDSDDDGEHGERQQEDVRAMKQFATSFLEAMLRFQPDMTHVSAAMNALKNGFLNTGPQLSHIIWSAVASTCTSVQLSGISSAIYSMETSSSASHESGASSKAVSSTPPTNPFSSLTINAILNAPVPCMKTRLAVSLPESLDSQLDPFSPKEDSKLNVLLRSLRRVPLLFKNRKQDFFHAICAPIISNLRLQLTPDEWENALLGGAALPLGQPILGQDLLYLSVAICSSMLHTKAEILLTLRSFCVLHMAQVLIQLARLPAEEQNDEDMHLHGCCSGATADAQEEGEMSGRTKEEDLEMQQALEQLMNRLSMHAGVSLMQQQQQQVEGEGELRVPPHEPLRGYQLLYLFKSACSAFMRQVTLLCRAFFRGESDPDESWCANFVSSLRLSTNFYDLCQQLGLPTVDQILLDADLMKYLENAATQLQHTRFASVPESAQESYTQTGHVDVLLEALEEATTANIESNPELQLQIIRSNLDRIPKLPFRRTEDANGVMRHYFANIRLTKLSASYTDLHCEILGKSKCKQTWRVAENPALCLACGEILCAGSECCRRRSDNMGACTYHAITCGNGVGLFFLIRSSSVLLIFGPRSSYFGSPYLDMFGEEDINIRRGRPLHLSTKRMRALQALYANHLLANEVARNRRTSDQYIRSNYY